MTVEELLEIDPRWAIEILDRDEILSLLEPKDGLGRILRALPTGSNVTLGKLSIDGINDTDQATIDEMVAFYIAIENYYRSILLAYAERIRESN